MRDRPRYRVAGFSERIWARAQLSRSARASGVSSGGGGSVVRRVWKKVVVEIRREGLRKVYFGRHRRIIALDTLSNQELVFDSPAQPSAGTRATAASVVSRRKVKVSCR